MAEFYDLPAPVASCANILNLLPTTDDELGVSASALNSILTAASSSNYHTKPPQADEKLRKKTVERLQQTTHSSHLNPFLRLYMQTSPEANSVDPEAMRSCLAVCSNNDPEWVHSCQCGALKLLQAELEARSSSGSTPHVKGEEPVMLAQLRGSLPPLAPSVPRVTLSTVCHFKFVVDTALGDTKDRYFSSQVKIKCDSKGPVGVKVLQRLSLVDGVESHEVADFQCLLDKQTLKKGDSCVIMLSLIAKPYAVFNSIQEMVVLGFDDVVRVVITFLVVNPSTSLFGTGPPCCLTQTVQQSPLGLYAAPLFLQILKHQFIRQQGNACKDVVHLLYGYSHMYAAKNRDTLRQAQRLQSQLEDDLNIGELLHQFGSTQPGAAASSTASYRPVPASTAQPLGYAPGAAVPTSGASQSSLTTFPNVATQLPDALHATTAPVVFTVMLIWLSQLPMPIFDASLMQCDPVTFFETLQPSQQGVVLWVVDLCCGMLQHAAETEVSLRSLALTFAAVLASESGDDHSALEEVLISDAEGETLMRERLDDAWRRRVQLKMHAATAFVHWLSLYEPVYTKAAKK